MMVVGGVVMLLAVGLILVLLGNADDNDRNW